MIIEVIKKSTNSVHIIKCSEKVDEYISALDNDLNIAVEKYLSILNYDLNDIVYSFGQDVTITFLETTGTEPVKLIQKHRTKRFYE